MRNLFRQSRILLLITFITTLLSISASFYWNYMIQNIINAIAARNRILTEYITIAVYLILLNAFLQYAASYVSSWACETISHKLRINYASGLLDKSPAELSQINAGAKLSELQNELAEVTEYLSNDLFPLINKFLSFIATSAWFLYLNPTLAIIANLPNLFIMIYVFYSSRAISGYAAASQAAKAELNSYAGTLLTLFPIMKLYDSSAIIQTKYDEKINEWSSLSVKEEKIRARLMSLSALISTIPLLLTLLTGGYMVIKGIIAVGTVYIFINLSGNVSGVFMNMPSFIASYRRFSANIKRIEKTIN